MDCSTPGLPVYHQLPEFTQTHVHRVGDTIQPSHPLLSPSPPTFNLSQHQGLFHPMSQLFISGGQTIGVSVSASVLPMNTLDWFPLGWTGWISLPAYYSEVKTDQLSIINSCCFGPWKPPEWESKPQHIVCPLKAKRCRLGLSKPAVPWGDPVLQGKREKSFQDGQLPWEQASAHKRWLSSQSSS